MIWKAAGQRGRCRDTPLGAKGRWRRRRPGILETQPRPRPAAPRPAPLHPSGSTAAGTLAAGDPGADRPEPRTSTGIAKQVRGCPRRPSGRSEGPGSTSWVAVVTSADALLRGRGPRPGAPGRSTLFCVAKRPRRTAPERYSLKVRFPRKLMQKYNSLVNTAAYVGSRVAEEMSLLKSGVEI